MGLLGKAARKRGGQIYDDVLNQLTPEQKQQMLREAQERALRAQAEAIEDPTLDRVQDAAARAAMPGPSQMPSPSAQPQSYNMGMRVQYPGGASPSAMPPAAAGASGGGGGIAGRIRSAANAGYSMLEDGVGRTLQTPLAPAAAAAAGGAYLYNKSQEAGAERDKQFKLKTVFDMVATGRAETLLPLEQLNSNLGTNYASYAEAISDPENGDLIGQALLAAKHRQDVAERDAARLQSDQIQTRMRAPQGMPAN